jgi:hypothetical protein
MFITNEYLTNNDGIGCWRRIAKVKPGKHMPKYVFHRVHPHRTHTPVRIRRQGAY